MNDTQDSPLAILNPLQKPDCTRLLDALKTSLNRATAIALWTRMEQNHWARFCWWPGQDWSCRKITLPGQKPPLPWPNSADLRIRLVDNIIKEYGDLLDTSERRVTPQIMPAMMDLNNEDAMEKSSAWGAVMEYYGELTEYERQQAKAQWRAIAWEYGHGIIYTGWNEERQMLKRTLDAQTVVQLIAKFTLEGIYQDQQPPDAAIEQAQGEAVTIVVTPELRPELIAALQLIDPDITPKIARYIAPKLLKGTAVDYYVPQIVKAATEHRALTPGLDVFYPPETTTIQKAEYIVMPEWWSDVEMKANVETRGWKEAAVKKIIAEAVAGRATFFNQTTTGAVMGNSISWLLTGGMIGMGIRDYDFAGERDMRQWQLITVFYRATDPETGVPVLYRTTFHPDLPEHPVFHGASLDAHARYPFAEYKRETDAPTLWSSRGVGELSFSEQEELRFQANFCFDNAAISIRPPYEVNARSDVAVIGLAPGQRVTTTSSGMNAGIKKIDVGGDAEWSIEVQKMAKGRTNDYFKMGMAEDMDPIAKQTAQQARVDEWILACKQMMKLEFATIQQYCPEQIRVTAVNGRQIDLNVSRADIQGEFSVFMQFDVAMMDPKAIEAKAKMVREFISPMDRQGLIQIKPLLDILMQGLFPMMGKTMVSSGQQAQEQQIAIAKDALIDALLGLEPDYSKLNGGDPKTRKDYIMSKLMMPALDEKGQPIPDPATGAPLPGRPRSIAMRHPDVAALLDNLLKAENFQEEQQDNVEVGRIGVKPIQGMNGNSM